LAYDQVSTLLDYLPSSFLTVWMDELSLSQTWESEREDWLRGFKEASETHLVVPSPDLLVPWPALEARLKQASGPLKSLYLDQLELADLEEKPTEETPPSDGPSPRHRIAVNANSALTPASRHSLDQMEEKFRLWLDRGFRVLILTSTQSQLERLLLLPLQ
jgi:hypothetical protein